MAGFPSESASARFRRRFASCAPGGENIRSKSSPVSPIATTRGSVASAETRSHAAASVSAAACGWTPTATPARFGKRSLSASAAMDDASSQPGTRSRSTPASSAAAMTSAMSPVNGSAWRWQCVSTRRMVSRARRPRPRRPRSPCGERAGSAPSAHRPRQRGLPIEAPRGASMGSPRWRGRCADGADPALSPHGDRGRRGRGRRARLTMRLVDTHCHLQAEPFTGDIAEVIAAAELAGVERLLVPGWDEASSIAALALSDRFPNLAGVAVGVHPHAAAEADAAAWERISALATDPRVVAIGETGLDFDRMFSPPGAQLANLRRNLALALSLGKPAILHCRSKVGARDAQDALIGELRAAGFGTRTASAAFGERPPAVLHSVSGPVDYVEAALGL